MNTVQFNEVKDLATLSPAVDQWPVPNIICNLQKSVFFLARSKWGWRADPAGTGDNAQRSAAEGRVQRRYPVLH
eukprot:219143-Pelagomonas_calceolata.AAC.1